MASGRQIVGGDTVIRESIRAGPAAAAASHTTRGHEIFVVAVHL